MENINKIKEVEAKPEVNIFMRKPFIAGERKQQEDMQDRGFQKMLDEDIEELRKEGKSFTDTIEAVEEKHKMTPSEIQLMELKKLRRDITSIPRDNLEESGPRLK